MGDHVHPSPTIRSMISRSVTPRCAPTIGVCEETLAVALIDGRR